MILANCWCLPEKYDTLEEAIVVIVFCVVLVVVVGIAVWRDK